MSKLIFICVSWVAMLVWGEFVILKLYAAVANQEIPLEGGNPNLLFSQIFANNCMKNERIWTSRRGLAFLASPPIRQMHCHNSVPHLCFSAARRRSWTVCSSGRCARFSSVSPRSRPHRPRPRSSASSSTRNKVKPNSHYAILHLFIYKKQC